MASTIFEVSRRWIEHFDADVKQAYMNGLSEGKDGDVKLHHLGCVPSSFSSTLLFPLLFPCFPPLPSPSPTLLCYSPAERKSEACEARGYCSRCLH